MNDTRQVSAQRWQHLVTAGFTLQRALDEGREPTQAARDALDSALEVFTSDLEPADDFEAYAVRRLLLGVRRALLPPDRGDAS